MKDKDSICLIGMPGSGKSTIGKKLAKQIGYKFIDIDDYIERVEKMTLQQIIEKKGGDYFCSIEEKYILELLPLKHHVIAPGGSIIYSEKAMRLLQKSNVIVFLNVPLPDLKERLTDMESRGIVGLRSKTLHEIYKERISLYRKYANIVINSGSKGPNEIIEEMVKRIKVI